MVSKGVLVDHTFIVAGGEITKAARNWLGFDTPVLKEPKALLEQLAA
jgi:hypothetical protein